MSSYEDANGSVYEAVHFVPGDDLPAGIDMKDGLPYFTFNGTLFPFGNEIKDDEGVVVSIAPQEVWFLTDSDGNERLCHPTVFEANYTLLED